MSNKRNKPQQKTPYFYVAKHIFIAILASGAINTFFVNCRKIGRYVATQIQR
jgi:hypothetical protein